MSLNKLSSNESATDSYCSGMPPLKARCEPWMDDVLNNPELPAIIEKNGSPLNAISTNPLQRNINALNQIAAQHETDFRVFFARKANKCLSFVEAAAFAEAGIDVASENELRQTLDAGVLGPDIICTAAIKNESLIRLCLEASVVIAVDNRDELDLIQKVDAVGRSPIAIRLSGFNHDGSKLPSRFGVDIDDFPAFFERVDPEKTNVAGLHFHLDGYCHRQRVSAIQQSLSFVNVVRKEGHSVEFLDIGGGIPMSYLDDPVAWDKFWQAHEQSISGTGPTVTYRDHPLGRTVHNKKISGPPNCYPYYQALTQADWLDLVLGSETGSETGSSTIAATIRDQDLQLRCEPGRSLLDGCGITIARVEFRKRSANGDWLIGLAMNRTQCRTGSDDFLVDPILIPCGESTAEIGSMTGYLVGAYCTEAELITLRRLYFPTGVRRGDLSRVSKHRRISDAFSRKPFSSVPVG